jgi:hypothetical protein
MALRWTSAAMVEAAKGFRRLKAYKQLSALRTALAAHQTKHAANSTVELAIKAAESAHPAMPAQQNSTKTGTTPVPDEAMQGDHHFA